MARATGLLPGAGLAALLAVLSLPSVALTFAEAPLFLSGTVKPNVLVIYDNSQSMDGTMAGQVIAGDDALTRGNIARTVLRDTVTRYRSAFNWGLESFELVGAPQRFFTYGYFFGSAAEVVYTNDCVAGVSASNGGLRCLVNPEPGNGFGFLTYGLTGDDPSINDVLYIGGDFGPQMYGRGVHGGTNYHVFLNHQAAAGNGWGAADFFNGFGAPWGFTPTDAGFLPETPPHERMFWLRRAWGYLNNITGAGVINEPVEADGNGHFTDLTNLLAAETGDAVSAELKNAAVFTPLAGSLATAQTYFANNHASLASPIAASCQRNFVLLATDGNPTGKTDGSMYTLAEQANSFDAGTSTWTFSTAANHVFDEITGLRNTTVSNNASINGSYDVQTYVIGLGDTVANASSIATLNRMASLGGTTQAMLAGDAASLATAFDTISRDIIARSSAAATVTLNAGSWSSGTQVYQARFNSGDWSGQLLAYAMAADGSLSALPTWDASQRLNLQDWDTGRQILTSKPSASLGSRGIAFRWPADAAAPTAAELDASMITALNTSLSGTLDGQGAARLRWLRGQTTREQRNCAACAAPVFRNRPISVLGDIINSAPIYVSGGGRYLREGIESVSYSSWKASRMAKTPLVFAGANDGMLHAFNASTGDEVFAYVPSAAATRLSALTDPTYSHRYTVDGSPAAADAFYGGAWHTLLVSGMGAGAKGLFALDVSDPDHLTEADAASVVRWEIGGGDADVGHILAQPVVAKLKNGRWVAIVGNGYNSSNARAVLLLVDLETGAITRIDTLSGSAGAPNGLSAVVAVSSAHNGVADTVYAGDLAGQVWKFDLSSATAAGWGVAYGSAASPQPLFTAAAGQAITARLDVTAHPQGGWMLVFGSGRYLDVADTAAGSSQALYGIWDNGSVVPTGSLVDQSVLGQATADGRTWRFTSHVVGAPSQTSYTGDSALTRASYLATKRGWKLTLPSSGERIVAQASIRYGKAIVSTLIPNTALCSFGGDGWVLEVDAITGNRPDAPALDSNADNLVTTSDLLSYDGGNAYASGVRINAIPAAPGFVRTQNRSLDDKLVNTSNGTVVRVREAGNAATSRRTSWEQLQ